MELKEFIEAALTDIVGAVEKASKDSCRNITLASNNERRTVEFDVAVSTETKGTASGKAGIKVLSFIETGGDIQHESKNSTVSRISFGVSVDVWTKEEQAEHERQANAQLSVYKSPY